MVSHADPVLFGIVSSADHPIITCFGVTAADARIRKADWVPATASTFAQHSDELYSARGPRNFLPQNSVILYPSATEYFTSSGY